MRVSLRRRNELRRIDRDAVRIRALFLAPDTQEPRIFDKENREALLIVLRSVVEAESVFARLKVLRSVRARTEWVDWLCTTIRGSMDWYANVKLLCEMVCGVRLEHPDRLPSS